MIEVPVLVVGGGPVGLTASLLLSQHGVKSLLVERHPGTSVLPKARGINARTMELYRQAGVEASIRAAGPPSGYANLIVWAESLAGAEIERRVPGRLKITGEAVTPVANCLCSQDLLEPVLRQAAEAAAPEGLRFGTELAEFTSTADGVSGKLLVRASGEMLPFRTRYLLAADGARSPIRQQLGIQRHGELNIYDSVNIHCRADLRPWTEARPASLYYIEQPDLRGTFLTIDGADRWGFLVHSLAHYGFTADNLTPERAAALVRQAAGVPELNVEVLGIGFWQCSAMVTERFQDGSVFLLGDAAHETTPSGGFGMNLGVQDAQNLAWKLAAVLHGHAHPSLLDSYDIERRPAAEATVHASLLNMKSLGRTSRQNDAKLPRAEYLNEQGLIFGIRYDSAAIVPDGAPLPPVSDPVVEYVASAHPGCRAPHVALTRGGEPVSTIDLFGRGFVLLAGPYGGAWRDAAAQQAAPRIEAHVMGEDGFEDHGAWSKAYGVTSDGAVLVRPDGYVAWRSRSMSPEPARALAAALAAVLGDQSCQPS